MAWLRSLLLGVALFLIGSLAPAPASAQTYVLPRIATESSVSVLVVGAGMAAGGFIGWFADGAMTGPCLRDECSVGVTGLVIGASLGALLTAPLSVMIAGSDGGGRGDFGATYLGALSGAAVAALPISLLVWAAEQPGASDSDRGGFAIAALACSLVFPAVGAVVGYELSDAEARLAALPVEPRVSLGPDGASLGVAGSF